MKKLVFLMPILCSAMIACSTPTPKQMDAYSGNGVVESITMAGHKDNGINAGTIAGGVIGGLVGNQVGSGRGQTAATIAGAVGGAYAGNQIEQRRQQGNASYNITVRMDDGSRQTILDQGDSFRTGDRVRIDNDGRLTRR